ncbi:DUF4179 domain-containing protein [Cytobacillus sp. FJAT-53684]|uniref:DUF4179 domain-containing protein n=1 Tax=Cytobacillus mangrovibacter TaxID=3299024 RepID=A0ABW6K6K5_9BACI
MFEKEERELERSGEAFNHLSISDDLANRAILEGMSRAKDLKKKNHLPIKTLLAASIIIIGFISSINVSDPMADYFSTIPGMEKVIEFVRYDKGLLAAAENDYIQKVGVSKTYGGIEVKLDSIVHDENSLIVFYEFQALDEADKIFPENIMLIDKEGQELHYMSYQHPNSQTNDDSLIERRYTLPENESLPKDLILSFQFSKNGVLIDKTIDVPFTLNKEKFASKKTFQLNKTVEVENQKMTIKKIELFPTKTAVHITYNPENTKKIFGFTDLQLVDENGVAWGMMNLDGLPDGKEPTIIYLESNYFSNPKKLFLQFNSLRALDKDDIWVEVDPIKEIILKGPKDGKISEVYRRKDELAIKLEINPNKYNTQIFMYAVDSNGDTIAFGKSFGAGMSPVNNYITYYIPYLPEEAAPGPIKVELLDYPTTIQENVKIEIK